MNPNVRSTELAARPLPQWLHQMSRVTEIVGTDPAGRKPAADARAKEDPDEDDDEDDDEKDQDDDEDDGNSDGYSE
jgi:hypothetical protein